MSLPPIAALPAPDDGGVHVSKADLIRLGRGSAQRGRARLRLLLADEREHDPISAPVVRPPAVRLATQRDEPALHKLLLEDLAENALAIAPPSSTRIAFNLEIATRGRGGFCPVIDGPNGPVALALLLPTEWWWSDRLFLQEIVLYVSPQARHGHAGRDLLMYEKWLADTLSEESGERWFVLAGVTATQRGDAKMRLYGRHMNQVGGFFVYPPVSKE